MRDEADAAAFEARIASENAEWASRQLAEDGVAVKDIDTAGKPSSIDAKAELNRIAVELAARRDAESKRLDLEWKAIQGLNDSIASLKEKLNAPVATPVPATEKEIEVRRREAEARERQDIEKSRQLIADLKGQIAKEQSILDRLEQNLVQSRYTSCPNNQPYETCDHYDLRKRYDEMISNLRNGIAQSERRIGSLNDQLTAQNARVQSPTVAIANAGAAREKADRVSLENRTRTQGTIGKLEANLNRRLEAYKKCLEDLNGVEYLLHDVYRLQETRKEEP